MLIDLGAFVGVQGKISLESDTGRGLKQNRERAVNRNLPGGADAYRAYSW